MASYDVDFTIRADLDAKSAAKVEREIEKTAKNAEKSFRKVRTALEVSQGKQGANIKAQRDKLGINDANVKVAYAAVQKYVDQLNKVAEIETKINAIRNDPARQRDIANTQDRLRRATANRDKYAEGTDERKRYQEKVDAEMAHLAKLKEQIAPLEDNLKLNKDFAAELKNHLAGVVTQFKKAEKPADAIFKALGISVQESDQLAATAAKTTTGVTRTAAATEGLARTEAKTANEKVKSIATTKKEDDSLKGLLTTLAKYKAELDSTAQAGKETANVEQKIADTTDKINQKFNFTPMSESIADLTRRYQELRAAKSALESAGIPKEFDNQYAQIIADIEQTKTAINDYKKQLRETSAEQTKTGQSGIRFSETIKIATEGMRNALAKTYRVFTQLAKLAGTVFNAIGKSMSAITSHFKSLPKSADHIKSSFGNMAKSMRSNFKHLLTSITKYVFGFRSLFFLVRRLRKYLGEGIKNLAQFEGGNNAVNESITDMLSSLLYLKNAWAAAFSPIIQFVRPILTQLIDSMAEVGNAVARFLSFLFGQEIAFNAVKVDAQDYADSLDSAAGSAGSAADKTKKLTDRLAAFDDLNVLGKDDDPDSTGSGGGGGGADAYMPDPNEMFKIVDPEENGLLTMLMNAWKTADFTEVGKLIANKLTDSLSQIDWDTIQKQAYKIGQSFVTLLNGVFADNSIWSTVADTLAQALNTAMWAAYGFVLHDTTDWGGGFATFVNTLYEKTDWQDIQDLIRMFINNLATNIGSFFDNMNGEDFGTSISGGLVRFLEESDFFAIDRTTIEEDFGKIGEFFGSFIDGLFGDPEAFKSTGKLFSDTLDNITLAVKNFFEETDGIDFGGNWATGLNEFLNDTDWEGAGSNINEALTQIMDNIQSFLDTLDVDAVKQAINDFMDGLDVPGLVIELRDTTIKLLDISWEVTKAAVDKLSDVIASMMYIEVSQGHISIVQDEEGNDVQLHITTDVDWTESPLLAWMDSVITSAGEVIVTLVLGISTTEEIEQGAQLVDTIAEDVLKIQAAMSFISTILFPTGATISTIIADLTGGERIFDKIDEYLPGWGTALGVIYVVLDPIGALIAGIVKSCKEIHDYYDPSVVDDALLKLKMLSSTISFLFFPITSLLNLLFNPNMEGVRKKWEEFGENLKEGLFNGISLQDADSVLEWYQSNVFDPIWNALCELFGVHSPSTVMAEFGGYLIEGLKNGISNLMPDVKQIFTDFKDWLSQKWDEIKGNTYEKWVGIKTNVTTKAQEIKDGAVEKFTELKESLVGKWQEIKGSIYEKLVGIKLNIIGVFGEIKEGIKDPINQFLDVIEDMINNVIDGINYLFDKVNGIMSLGNEVTSALGLPNIPNLGHLSYVDIPGLAQGAVIPPNREFMAVLGDQSHGTNIEAPLDTIKQAVAEVLANNNNQEVIDLLQQLIRVVESKNLTIGDKEIGKANARYTNQQRMIRGTTF